MIDIYEDPAIEKQGFSSTCIFQTEYAEVHAGHAGRVGAMIVTVRFYGLGLRVIMPQDYIAWRERPKEEKEAFILEVFRRHITPEMVYAYGAQEFTEGEMQGSAAKAALIRRSLGLE